MTSHTTDHGSRSCIRQLDLRLSLPEALRSQSSQIAEELKQGFITRVVETIEQRLHANFGADAIIEIPVLNVKLEGEKKRFYDWDYAVQAGEDIASELLMQWQGKPRTELLQPVHEGGVKFYECHAHKQAQQLQLLAQSCQRYSKAWDYSELHQQWINICSEEKTTLQQVLNYMDEMSSLKLIVENISMDGLQLAVQVLPVSHWPASIQDFVHERLTRAKYETNEAGKSENATQTKPSATERHTAKSIDPDQEVSSEQKTSTKKTDNTTTSQPSGNNIYPLKTKQESSETEAEPHALPSNAHLALDALLTDSQLKKDVAAINSLDTPLGVENNSQREPGGIAYYETAYGGLVYVLNLMLRIELPEILWCAAIDEKSFLFDLMSAMTGEEDREDSALHIVSGIDFDAKNYQPSEIPTWAWEEVIRKVYKNIYGQLNINSRLEFISQHYDVETFINTQKYQPNDPWISLVNACDNLLSSGFLYSLLSDNSDDNFLNYINLQGVIKVSDEEISVEMPMEFISIDVRRSALDVNPGYLQWQQRHCVIIFTE